MRPVPAWKLTAAAPTPYRLGATPLTPSALRPWQVAQFAAKSFFPASTLDWFAAALDDCVSAEAVLLNSAYAPPVVTSAITMSAMVASGERLPLALCRRDRVRRI